MLTWTFTHEGWKSHEDGINDVQRLDAARRKLGFSNSSIVLRCRFGSVYIYSRGPTSQCPFEFLCILSVQKKIFRWVWVGDLPCLIQFLREIDAHPSEADAENASRYTASR